MKASRLACTTADMLEALGRLGGAWTRLPFGAKGARHASLDARWSEIEAATG